MDATIIYALINSFVINKSFVSLKAILIKQKCFSPYI